MTLRRAKAAMLVCLAVWCLFAPGMAATTDEQQAQELRQRVLDRLTEYDSIECTYSYFYNLTGGSPIPDKVQFKAKGEWVWFSKDAQLKEGDTSLPKFRSETNVEGKIDCFFISSHTNERIFHAKGERFNFFACDGLSPLSFIGRNSAFSYWSFKDTLRDILASPSTCISEPEGDYTKLYVYPEPEDGDYEALTIVMGAILYLDKDEMLRRVDYVYRPQGSLHEVALYARKNAAKDVYRRTATLWFDDLVVIDGRPFPTKLKEVVWDIDVDAIQDRDEVMEAQELYARKQITACESGVRLWEATNFWKEETVYQVEIDPQSIKINNPLLTREDFVIDPPDPDVYWNRETDDVKDKDGWANLNELRAERAARIKDLGNQRQGNLVVLASTALLCISASSVISIVLLKRRAKRQRKSTGTASRHV